jgi:hypothetical protein
MTPHDVVRFWAEEVGEKRWFEPDLELDADLARRFGDSYTLASGGKLGRTAPKERSRCSFCSINFLATCSAGKRRRSQPMRKRARLPIARLRAD